jgi:hypothetical protein
MPIPQRPQPRYKRRREEEAALRDYFAAKALPIMFEQLKANLSSSGEWQWSGDTDEDIAEGAFHLADAMLEQRGR